MVKSKPLRPGQKDPSFNPQVNPNMPPLWTMPISGDKHPDGLLEYDPNRVMEGNHEVTYDENGRPEILMQLDDTNQISGTMQGPTGVGAGAVGGYGKKRVGQESRRQMNLTSGRTKSILTS